LAGGHGPSFGKKKMFDLTGKLRWEIMGGEKKKTNTEGYNTGGRNGLSNEVLR